MLLVLYATGRTPGHMGHSHDQGDDHRYNQGHMDHGYDQGDDHRYNQSHLDHGHDQGHDHGHDNGYDQGYDMAMVTFLRHSSVAITDTAMAEESVIIRVAGRVWSDQQ